LRRGILAALVGVGLLIAATPRESFNAVIKRYAGLRSLKASFNEQICSKKDGTCYRLNGTFTYASPNMFRIDVTTPSEQLVVSDGITTWIYLPSANQAIQTKPGPEQDVFLFVGKLTNYSEQYTVELKTTKDWLEAHFTAKPGKQVFLEKFVLLIDPSKNDLAGVKVEQGDQEITFLLEEVSLNPTIPDGRFTFSPPEGTTVIKDTGTGYQ